MCPPMPELKSKAELLAREPSEGSVVAAGEAVWLRDRSDIDGGNWQRIADQRYYGWSEVLRDYPDVRVLREGWL